ncbi:HTH domain-containing protein [Elizabethkingia ursingii]|uniref:HTH domain-containing protein n=1 Tax=Elizabethkingia TaxID=308865 RepID=UPI000D2F689C|nr:MULTISPECIES: HTH domain-containing protein [Elizabethkingia]MCL1670062.1 HTH domain-containing protein [Elizabethkingia ursingii]PUB34699.1 HTH domain-containing protein [Elizabethkingia sp. YR214]
MNNKKAKSPSKNKGVQKFTEIEKKINTVFELKKVTINDITNFNKEEQDYFSDEVNRRINKLQGEEQEKLYTKLEDVLHPDIKNQRWEVNHYNIMWAISTLTKEYANFPPVNFIAEKLNLSRTTIYKHLKTFKESALYKEQQQSIELMADKIIWQMYSLADRGDVKAARLFLDIAGKTGKNESRKPHQIKNQNNFIQINGMVFNEQILNKLSPDQLSSIEGILKTVTLKDQNTIEE